MWIRWKSSDLYSLLLELDSMARHPWTRAPYPDAPPAMKLRAKGLSLFFFFLSLFPLSLSFFSPNERKGNHQMQNYVVLAPLTITKHRYYVTLLAIMLTERSSYRGSFSGPYMKW